MEVNLARPPSVFVRDLSPEEAQRLRRVSRQSKVFALRQRAQILLASDSQVPAPEIARVLQTDENQVRRVIAEFNLDGMDSLRPPIGGGHPRRIDDDTREAIRAIALARPCDLGEPATRWSLSRLRRYLIRHRVVKAISKEHLRRLLNKMGITAQRTRTWKWSNDPLYELKKQWVLGAYKAAEAGTLDGVLVSFDECGPISLKPHPGRGWFARKRPARQRATYKKNKGVRKLLGAYDVGADRLWGRLEARSVNATVVLAFLKDIRRRYPPDGSALHRDGRPVRALDPTNPRLGCRQPRRPAAHTDQRQPSQPHRVPLLGLRRVRHQRLRLPRLGRVLQGHPGLHPPTQPRPPRPPHQRTRKPTQGRLTHYRRMVRCRPTRSSWALEDWML